MRVFRSDVMRSVYTTAKGLRDVGIMDEAKFQEIEARAFIPPPSPEEIHLLMESQAVEQSELAHELYVAPELIEQWETGKEEPEGPALKLLDLVRRKGIDAIR